MRRFTRSMVAVVALSTISGCAGNAPPPSGPKADLTIITREQIQELRFSNAYDAVKGLRGNWLNTRGGAESIRYPMDVQVYLDGVHLGGADVLQGIASPPIQYIRFFSPLEATARWGVDHGRGAIYISTKAAARPGTPPGA